MKKKEFNFDEEEIRREFEKHKLDYWDFRVGEKKVREIIGWNKEVRRNAVNLSKGFCARVFIDGNWGFAASSNFVSIKEIIQKAVKLARLKKQKNKISLTIPKSIKDKKKTPQKINFEDVSDEEKINFIKSLSEKGIKFNNKIKSVMVRYLEILEKKKFLSQNSFIEQDISRGSIRSLVSAKSSLGDEEKFIGVGKSGGYEFTEKIEEKLSEACKRAVKFLDAKKGKPGEFPVLIDGILTGLLVHEALGHAAEADHIMQGSCCLVGKLGEKLSNENVNVCDDATENNFKSWGSYYYDEEGVSGSKTYLIKEGVLNSYLHNMESAGILKNKLTGNARAESVFSMPVIRMSNTYVEKKDADFNEMLKEIKNGYYMSGSKGGEVDPSSGNFQFSAEDVYLIKNGEIVAPLKSMSFGGNLLEVLKSISLVGKEYESEFPGMCGKMGQSVPVSGTCPNITLKKASIS